MTTIYLIRHGQASFGQKNYDQLSKNGELQAEVLGQYLKQLLNEQPYVVAGAMQRHQHTAQLAVAQCFPDVDIQTNADWNEFNHEQIFAQYDVRFSQPELIKQELQNAENAEVYLTEVFNAAMQRWTGGEYHHEYEESWPSFKQRINQALITLLEDLARHKPRYALVFTSGGVISSLVGQLLELSLAKTFDLSWAIANASMTTLKMSHEQMIDVADQAKLLSLNEHHFLKADALNAETLMDKNLRAEDVELLTWM
ncbi:broad specificity phosphatase PhoE [Acinetobacter calcoaceticus]|uniref:Broad specificity phosphatase PhoE n=1 Tax=Acinetobacter calcoaceticus TaxID=471 RepID=A0A4R1XTI6_ACICA|nr:broad specificity phosphatase PhoE [Acinetobacter calcoaceticus]